ncbi:hypothetical protein BGZ60DRAFT_230570 [Tricladium varicosporioides]|nr:hypothetical protein BGZ60DRAFT_230570 [Hymenoscyphus varicosporioides]
MQYLGLVLGLAASALALPARNNTQFYSNSTKPLQSPHHVGKPANTLTRTLTNGQAVKSTPVSLAVQGNKQVTVSAPGQVAKPSPASIGGQANKASVVTVTVTATPSSPGYSGNGVGVFGGSAGSCNGAAPAPQSPSSSPVAQLDQKPKAAGGSASSGYWSGATASSSHAGPVSTLAPVVHWNIDTSKLSNVVPIQVGTGSPQYYAQGGVINPNKVHFFGTMTYFFTGPSVHLDYSDFITRISYSSSGTLVITFASQQAYNYASSTWKVGLILITHTTECGGPSGKGCYFVVSTLNFQANSLSVTCGGAASEVQGLITHGDTEWGVYEPKGNVRPGKGSWQGSHSASGAFSTTLSPTSTAYTSTATGYPSSSTSSGGASPTGVISGQNGTSGTTTPSQNTTSGTNSSACVPPIDSKYGLPTACLGNKFDLELDTDLGIIANNGSSFDDFLAQLAPGAEEDGDLVPTDSVLRRRSLARKRGFWSWVSNKVIKPAAQFVAKKVEQAVQVAKQVVTAVAQALTISKDFSTNMDMQIPKSSSLQDPSAKVVASPWGNSILLKSFGDADKTDETTGTASYLNIFCVDCGAKGSAQISGKAAYTVPIGITEGWVQAVIDLDVVLKLGIDAQLVFKKEFNNNLFEVALPGLEYGIVKIGPMVSLGTHVTFEANAKGRVLAGAEFGLKKATARIDFVNPLSSSKSNWTPYFQPVFQADGEIMLSAELGLPIGLKCGVTVATWSKSVAIYDEPSVKAIAEFAASAKLDANNNVIAGVLVKNGCAGISTQVQWRNRLWADVLGLKTWDLYDTNYNTLAQGCIALPLPTVATTAEPTTTETSSVESTTAAGAESTTAAAIEPTTTADTDPTSAAVIEPTTTADTDPTTTAAPEPTVEATQAPVKRSTNPALDFPKLNYRRATNSTTSTNGTVKDLTSLVVSNTSTIDYNDVDIKPQPYNRTDGWEFTLLVDSSVTFLVTSCSNGNVYVQDVNATTPDECSDLWASIDDVTGMDGNARLMHYYSNTMAVTGVSRLRVSTKEMMPNGSVPMGLVPFDTNPGTAAAADQIDSDMIYFGVDMYENLFYTAVCTYSDNQTPKVFVLDSNLDIDTGLAILKSTDVEYSITGGAVSDCFALPLVQGQDEAGAWESDDPTENIKDSFQLDWTKEASDA